MKKITEIYDEYQIMPTLAEHQLRVAAVAKLLCNACKKELATKDVVITMLLHDMGNIIKFDLEKFPEFTREKGLEYWQEVQAQFKERFGNNEHQAHLKIGTELGISERVIELLDVVEFDKICNTASGNDWEKKICQYVDMRVGPHGVLSLADRLGEARKRYGIGSDEERWDLIKCAEQVEQQIFEHCSINPEDITDESIADIVEELKQTEI